MEKFREELKGLRQKKHDLIDKGMQIRDQLLEHETFLKNNKISTVVQPVELFSFSSQSTINSDFTRNSPKQLSTATGKITGITFENIKKKWLKDHIWLYKAIVKLKVIKFNMLLTVNKKSSTENEIINLQCTLSDVKHCYSQEVTPWIDKLTKSNNFIHLMSAFSDYNDQSVLRIKILNKLESEKIVNIIECTEEGGGLIAFVCDPYISKKIYVKFNWRLQLNLQTTSIDHVFDIDGIDNDFVNANEEILKNFCKRGLKKNELEKLWCNLCQAINEYKQR